MSMDWLSHVLGIIAEPLRAFGAKQFAYISDFPGNLDKLRDENKTLDNRRQDLQQRVEDLEQQHPRMKRTKEVEQWLTEAAKMVDEVNLIVQQGEEELQNRRSRNPMSIYNIGKRISEKIDPVTKLLRKGGPFLPSNSVIVWRLPGPLSMPEWPLENTVGLDSEVERVWAAIENGTVRVIRLCGQGGVGKTTLLKKVCNEFHRRRHDFEAVIWVSVPREKDYEKVQEVIRKKLGISDDLWKECLYQYDKGAQISSALKHRKFVLLLDDVWEQFDLINLGIQLWGDHSRSKIIFTARSLRFYLNFHIKDHVTIEVKCLPRDEALTLFRMIVDGSVLSSDPDLSELADTFASRCGGLPLALLTYAKALAGLKNPREWRHTIELSHTRPSEIADMGGYVFPLLKFSYDNLEKVEYKNCFLYCSLFPKDYNIKIDELDDLWVGEGFLDASNPHGQGVSTVEALKYVYLLETGESEQSVRMHDIIRHMALWLARDQGRKKNKVLLAKTEYLSDRELQKWKEAEWISLFGCISITAQIHSLSCPYLTTLFLKDGRFVSFPDGFFDSMPKLRVLNLAGTRTLIELPSSIGNVKKLQYINLSFTGLAKLPTGIGNLRNLKCLLLDYTKHLLRIPKEVISNLFLLQVYSKINGVGEYFPLVERLPYDEIAFLEVLECLNQIIKIGITVFCAPSLDKILESNTLRTCIRNLTLMGCLGLISLQFTEDVSNLERLEIFHCSSIKEIKIPYGCKLDNLSAICIGVCRSLLNLNSLAYAKNLESLAIFECESLEEVTSEEMEFRRLKTISFTLLQNLKSICPSSRRFPSLLEIEVSKCPLLSQLPFDLETANLLQKVRGETEWYDGLSWADEAVRDACDLKFVSTSFQSESRTLEFNEVPSGACGPPFEIAEDLTLENMEVIKNIGKGYGTNVQLIRHKRTGQFFTLKIIEMEMEIEESVYEKIVKKLSSIQSFECPHVVVYHDSFYNNGTISIILEYMDGGSLADFLIEVKTIPEPYIAAICKQVLEGLVYLHHEAHIIHRDIKPSKLLINSRGEVKITDFTESAQVRDSSGRANTFVGTYNYMSPERIVGDCYGIEADIWSLGLVLLECATGKFPYSPPGQAEEWTNFYKLMECIVEGPAPYAPPDQFSPEFCLFISACLQKDPNDRMSTRELLDLPFLNMYNNAKVNLSSYFSSARSPTYLTSHTSQDESVQFSESRHTSLGESECSSKRGHTLSEVSASFPKRTRTLPEES